MFFIPGRVSTPEETSTAGAPEIHTASGSSDLSCVIKPSHMRVAGGENAIRPWIALILLNREDQVWQCLLEAPSEEMGDAYYSGLRADAGARTEPSRSFEMLDSDVGLAR